MQGKEEAPDALHLGEEDENKEAGIQQGLFNACLKFMHMYRSLLIVSVFFCFTLWLVHALVEDC